MKQLDLFGRPIQRTLVLKRGYIIDYLTGKPVKDTPEERVRQAVLRSLVEEYGYEKRDIEKEYEIPMGRARKRADIVVFYSGKPHTISNVYIIVETKKEDIKPSDKKEGIRQLESYLAACPNAKYGLWVGSERIALEVIVKAGKKEFIQIPDIPPRWAKTVTKPTRHTLKPAVELKRVLKRIHNYIYANQGLPKDRAFNELLKLIFIKIFDELYSPQLQFYILPNEDMNNVRRRLERLFEKVKKRYGYIFKPDERIELNDRTLKYAVGELQRFSLLNTDADIKGEAYEEIVGPNLRGERGEFFTPRNVCRMGIDMLFSLFPEEQLITPGGIKILDPAVGTGGFLIVAIQRIRQILSNYGFKYDELKDRVREIADANIFGIDFNPFLVRVAQMNMFLHGDGSANIVHTNSLEHPSRWSDKVLETLFQDKIRDEFNGSISEFRKYLKQLKTPAEIDNAISVFDIVVTNPPFGTKGKIDDPDILRYYEITKFKASTPRSSLPPEQLFIERALQFLKPGGVLGIVLPDSILSNPGLKWLREWILRKTYVIAVVDLPPETFEPHTGTQTSFVILRKRPPDKIGVEEDYEIFMAMPEKVGHDKRGNPVYKLTPEGKILIDEQGNPVIEDHLPIVANLFKKWIRGELR